MTDLQVSSLRPLRNDVVLQYIPKERSKTIFIQEDKEEVTQFFRIVAAGPEVKFVEVGQVVVGDWRKMTNPVDALDNDGNLVKICITEEIEILAIAEGYDSE